VRRDEGTGRGLGWDEKREQAVWRKTMAAPTRLWVILREVNSSGYLVAVNTRPRHLSREPHPPRPTSPSTTRHTLKQAIHPPKIQVSRIQHRLVPDLACSAPAAVVAVVDAG